MTKIAPRFEVTEVKEYGLVVGMSDCYIIGGPKSHLLGRNNCSISGGGSSIILGGRGSCVRGGPGSILALEYWDKRDKRTRLKIVYVGEGGILPNTWYRVDEDGNFVPGNPHSSLVFLTKEEKANLDRKLNMTKFQLFVHNVKLKIRECFGSKKRS